MSGSKGGSTGGPARPGSTPPELLVLDGPVGTELLRRGVETPLPGWSAHALETHPEVVEAIHRDYAAAGARVHTTNTFRTRARTFPDRWKELCRVAVEAARAGIRGAVARAGRDAGDVGSGGRVAGSIAPLEDCYRPDLSPALRDPRGCHAEHQDLAHCLVDAGCDLLLCETFPLVEEGLLAAEAALSTGVETWVSFTPGSEGDLLGPQELAVGARRAVDLGASAVLVNCVPARVALEYVDALVAAVEDPAVRVGCYANAGRVDDRMGWSSDPGIPDRYAETAATWVRAGASVVGGCCGTGPEHVRALVGGLGPGS